MVLAARPSNDPITIAADRERKLYAKGLPVLWNDSNIMFHDFTFFINGYSE